MFSNLLSDVEGRRGLTLMISFERVICIFHFQPSYLDRVPVLAGEGILSLLLQALLALGESFVP